MEKTRLAEIIIGELERHNPGTKFEASEVFTNGQNKLGITIENEYGISPVVYVEDLQELMFEEHLSLNEVIEQAADAFRRGAHSLTQGDKEREIMQMLSSGKRPPDDHITCRLLPDESISDKRENLIVKNVADGISLVLEIRGEASDGGELRAIIPKGVFKDDEEELFGVALKNLADDAKFFPLSEEIWMLTNENNTYGAAILFGNGVAEKVSDVMGGEYYALPASKHEFLIVPDIDTIKLEALQKMLYDGNRTVCEAADVLSDTVYKYVNGKILAM